jgi:hypothetical protein
MSSPQGTIVIRPKYFALMWIFMLLKPKGSVDGSEMPLQWKQANPVPVPAGRHEVGVWCPYFFLRRMGYNSISVEVAPGAAVEVVWSAPWIIYFKGKISAQPVDPAAAAAA